MVSKWMPLLAGWILVGCSDERGDDERRRPREQAQNAEGTLFGTRGAPSADRCGRISAWSLKGRDDTGEYAGHLVVREGGAPRFVRHVDYAAEVRAPDGKRVAALWTGAATREGRGGLTLAVALRGRDFVAEAVGHKRSGDEPAIVEAPVHATLDESCGATVSFSIGTVRHAETWTATEDTTNPAATFPGEDRREVLVVPPLAPNEKAVLFAGLASFHALPDVSRYVGRAAFQAARFGEIFDRTDLQYYRSNPGTVRIHNKVLDPIAIAETIPRANAFGRTLAEKAALADREMEEVFTDRRSKCIVRSVADWGGLQPSGDAALWQGLYVVSQIERHRLTGSPVARQNVLNALDCLLMLQEIVPDKTQFARTIRTSEPDLGTLWRRGVGGYAGLDWHVGGNNDMVNGLFLGYARAYGYLCKPLEREPAFCARIRTNARLLADEVVIARERSNVLLSNWLAAYVSNGLTAVRYAAAAGGYWLGIGPLQQELAKLTTRYGVYDSSGVHLNFATYLTQLFLAEAQPLPGQTRASVGNDLRTVMGHFVTRFAPFRNVVFGLYGAASGQCAACREDVLWRLRELPIPKPTFAIDGRLAPGFEIAPFPDLPWKLDWTTTDRTLGLFGRPLFEQAVDDYAWKNSNREYRGGGGADKRAVSDYVFAYWYGRSLGVIGPAD